MSTTAPIDGIAFDLDGTLVDSAPDIAAALGAGLDRAGLPSFDVDRVRPWIGDGPDVLIVRALDALGPSAQGDDTLRARLRRDFDAHTLAHPLSHGSVYPGIAATLEHLHGRLPLAVVTNKPSPLAAAVVEKAGLSKFFRAVLGADHAQSRKPGPALLLEAAGRLAMVPARLLMVGDSALDLGAARAAGCPFALVTWGYGNAALSKEAIRWRVTRPDELLNIVDERPRMPTAERSPSATVQESSRC